MRLMKKREFEFAKEQLLNMKGFVSYCRDSYINPGRKIEEITPAFVDAAVKDEFLSPVYIESNTPDGQVAYFSPFQMYIIAMLRGNELDSTSGVLKSGTMMESIHPGFRWLKWGGSRTYNFNIAREEKDKISSFPNIFKTTEHFHNFILFLHSFKPYNPYDRYDELHMRHFNGAPELVYDFSGLEKHKKKLEKYGLTIEILTGLRHAVGNFALDIDPLSRWYRYMRVHPTHKKDLLTGYVLVAQELYALDDLMAEMISIVNGEKKQDLLEVIYGRNFITPYLMPRSEYIRGTDLVGLKAAIREFKRWGKEGDNARFIPEGLMDKLKTFQCQLKDFESRYGDRSYKSTRTEFMKLETKVKYEDLCTKAKNYVDQIKSQHLGNEVVVSEEDIQAEIARAIERVLDNHKRGMWSLFNTVSEKIGKEAELAKLEEGRFGVRGNAGLLELAKLQKATNVLRERKDEFDCRISDAIDFLLCCKCRKHKVREPGGNTSPGFMEKPLCDSCIEELSQKALDYNLEDWKAVKEGEWLCSECGGVLYKFVNRNIISLRTRNEVQIKIQLPYGRLHLEAKCRCGMANRKNLDWGWS